MISGVMLMGRGGCDILLVGCWWRVGWVMYKRIDWWCDGFGNVVVMLEKDGCIEWVRLRVIWRWGWCDGGGGRGGIWYILCVILRYIIFYFVYYYIFYFMCYFGRYFGCYFMCYFICYFSCYFVCYFDCNIE